MDMDDDYLNECLCNTHDKFVFYNSKQNSYKINEMCKGCMSRFLDLEIKQEGCDKWSIYKLLFTMKNN
jgi:hypothetical protein